MGTGEIRYRDILKTWWPLAASWLLMAVELPLLSAIIARLENPEINLAAYGGIVNPLALIIEAPVIMLLAASTALSKNWNAYQKIYRFMMVSGAVLTGLHILITFTPIYYWLVEGLLGVPEEIVEPARLGLMFMTPWTWAIGYRRFQQGVLIRFGYSSTVGIGTIIRLVTVTVCLAAGYFIKTIPGAAVGGIAQGAGVVAEAVFSGIRVRPVIQKNLNPGIPGENISWREFANFYIPLAITSFLSLIWQPIGSAALSRMPLALGSLAVWPVSSGLIFILRSSGFAFNEVVVALLDRENAYHKLLKFTIYLSLTLTVLHLAIAITPLAEFWFRDLSGLESQLIDLARIGFWLGLPLPLLSVFSSWYQGTLLNRRTTRGIPESFVVFLVVVFVVLGAGVALNKYPGLYLGMGAFSLATLAQVCWLWIRSRKQAAWFVEKENLRLT